MKEFLLKVSKPGRYIGNEWNAVLKNWKDVEVKVALVFPDTYEIGMSHLGWQILYHLLNKEEYVLAERVFAPWLDFEEMLRKKNIPLFSLESKNPLRDFDLIGFSLMYEMSYTNVLNILDLGGIPLFSQEREETFPLIVAGGTCTFNPEPLSPFIDAFVIGEGEEVILEIVELIKRDKGQGTRDKGELLKELTKIPGVYVPSLYPAPQSRKEFPLKVTKRIIANLDQSFFPTRLIVPFIDVVHNRVSLEIFRGCTQGCRFCQAGMIYRPVRERSLDVLLNLAEESIKKTGFEELSLLSLSTSDYTHLEELVEGLMRRFSQKGIEISLPSLRPDTFSFSLAQKLKETKKGGLTFVPEAGTQRMRDLINKKVSEDDLIEAVNSALLSGWTSLKLYFMIGLPGEKDEDIEGIVALTKRIRKEVKPYHKFKRINLSISSFVPKPHTPFQWERQRPREEIEEKQRYLWTNLRDKKLSLSWHSKELSLLEGVFSRGDKALGKVLHRAFRLGCKFDAWSEYFHYALWEEAFLKEGVDPSFYQRERSYDEVLPWEHIDSGVEKKFLIKEAERSKRGELTPDCRQRCLNCGLEKEGWCSP